LLLASTCLAAIEAHAADGTWLGGGAPSATEWTQANNWTSNPSLPTGTATFGASAFTSVGISSAITIGTMQFNAGAPAYTFTGGGVVPIDFTGAGIVNNSSFAPTLINQFITFHNSSSAGNANITNPSGIFTFQDTSTAANSTIDNEATLQFLNAATAGNATITNNDTTEFSNTSTAGTATITNNSTLRFQDTSSAGNATIINNAGNALFFLNNSTAANATITTNAGGVVQFQDTASGGNARFITNAGGSFDISQLTSGGTTAGSIEGAGTYFLGSKNLTVGGNNLSATVSGIITDGGIGGGVGGSLTKVGVGTQILAGINAYTGATTVNGGTLQVDGSIAASSLTTINTGGTLSGSGTVGNVLVASGGVLAPGPPAAPGAMTVSGNLAFQPGGVYAVQINGIGNSIAKVSGTATLTGGTVFAAFSGAHARSFDILHAAGGFGGTTFAGATSPNFAAGLTYTPTDVFLTLVPTFDQKIGWIAAMNMQLSMSGVDVTLEHIRDQLQKRRSGGGTTSQVTAYAPSDLRSQDGGPRSVWVNQKGSPGGAYAALVAPAAPLAPVWGTWIQGQADWQRNDPLSSSDAGHFTRTLNSQIGLDMMTKGLLSEADALVVGLVASLTKSNIAYTDTPTSAAMQGPGVGVYSMYVNGGFSTDLTMKFDFLDMHQFFAGLAPERSFGITNAGLSGNLQYKFIDDNNRFIEPTAGFSFTRAMFDTSVASVMGLVDSNTVRVQGGARVGGSWDVGAGINIDADLKGLVYSNVVAEPSSITPFGLPITPNDQGLLRGEIDSSLCFNLPGSYSLTLSGQVRFGQAIVGGSAGLNLRKQW